MLRIIEYQFAKVPRIGKQVPIRGSKGERANYVNLSTHIYNPYPYVHLLLPCDGGKRGFLPFEALVPVAGTPSYDGVNALGSLTKLQILSLSGEFGDRFDLNCVSGGFPQLQVFRMRRLTVQNWRLANGAMPRLQRLTIDDCYYLDGLPSELWSLTALTKVHVRKPSDAMAHMLRNLEMKNNRCELVVDME